MCPVGIFTFFCQNFLDTFLLLKKLQHVARIAPEGLRIEENFHLSLRTTEKPRAAISTTPSYFVDRVRNLSTRKGQLVVIKTLVNL